MQLSLLFDSIVQKDEGKMKETVQSRPPAGKKAREESDTSQRAGLNPNLESV